MNGLISNTFQIHRGTRQGCLLSPLLFALAIEPLAAKNRNHKTIKGLLVGELEERVSLYAYYMLLYLGDSDESLSAAVSLIQEFGDFSGFRIKWTKLVLFPMDPQPNLNLPAQCSLAVVKKFKYLGILVKSPVSSFAETNLWPIIMTFNERIQK